MLCTYHGLYTPRNHHDLASYLSLSALPVPGPSRIPRTRKLQSLPSDVIKVRWLTCYYNLDERAGVVLAMARGDDCPEYLTEDGKE